MKLATLASVALVPILAFGQAASAAPQFAPRPIPEYRITAAVNCAKGDYKSSEVWSWSLDNGINFPWNPEYKKKITDGSTITWEGGRKPFGALGSTAGVGAFNIDPDAFSKPFNTRVGRVTYESLINVGGKQYFGERTDDVYVMKKQLDFDGWTCWVIYVNRNARST
ncbi:hypothetical protein HDU86_007117 [Geranomyces michiganensis]|nr:hypothetical protein HDU86_007117 [Geranomyces michiganensis]